MSLYSPLWIREYKVHTIHRVSPLWIREYKVHYDSLCADLWIREYEMHMIHCVPLCGSENMRYIWFTVCSSVDQRI